MLEEMDFKLARKKPNPLLSYDSCLGHNSVTLQQNIQRDVSFVSKNGAVF